MVKVIRDSVGPRLDGLNATFLPILDHYIDAAQKHESGNPNVVGVLLGLRQEVLALLAETLPPELKVLQGAIDAATPAARVEVLRQHSTGEASPSCDAATLLATASRLLDDVEGDGASAPADARLMARVCLVREELRQLVAEGEMGPPTITLGASGEEDRSSGIGGPPPQSMRDLGGVPQREVAFLKEILAVEGSERRRALLQAAFQGQGGMASGGARPGALLESVRALQAEMTRGDVAVGEGVLLRLEAVWRESLLVLEDMAGDAAYSP